MVCTPILDGDLGEYMSPRIGRSDIPDIREFLDNLPKKPCPSKLPEEYCKLCRRLNGEVAHYCETRELPSRPMEEILEEGREFEEEEEIEEPIVAHKVPILERPRYEEGETSLEFVPSEKSIEEARRSLPRFLPVHRGPRPFRPLEEFGPEEFETFTLERPSIFKHPSLIAEGEEGMMFTLISDEGAIEVTPLDMDDEGSIPSETVFESSEGVVEVVETSEGEEETPFFQFIEEGEGEIVEAEIVEVEMLEEGTIPEEHIPKEGEGETETHISDLAEEKEKGEIVPGKPRKRPKIKKRFKFKKVREKKPKKARKAKAKPEPAVEEPQEEELIYKKELRPMEETEPSEEMKTLAGLLGEKLQEEPREEISEQIQEPKIEEQKSEEEPIEEGLEEALEPEPSKEMMVPEDIEPEAEIEEQIPKEEIKEEISEDVLEPEPSEEIIHPEGIESETEIEKEKPEEELKEELPAEVEEKAETVAGPTPIEAARVCPKCGGDPSYIEQYQMYYCYSCNEYVEPVEKAMKETLEPEPTEEITPSEEKPPEEESKEEGLEEMAEPQPGEDITPPKEIKFELEMEGEEPTAKKGKKKKVKKKKKLRMKKIKLKRSATQEDEKEVANDIEETE